MKVLEALQIMEDKTFYSNSFGEEEITVMRDGIFWYTLGRETDRFIGIEPQTDDVKYLFRDYKKKYSK